MARRNEKGQFVKGVSGNPSGRPPKADAIRRLLEGDAETVAAKVLEAARNGDLRASEMVLARTSPIRRASHEPVNFTLDESQPLSEQGKAILSGIASGDIPPDTGKHLIDSLASLVKVQEMEEIDRRLNALENQNNKGD